jgi:sugar phosphate isomerase/epimerase
MSNVDLIASYWTLAGGALPHSDREYSTFEFRERVAAAARAGFKGIGLWHADLEHVLKTCTLAQMKRILDDNGLVHVELEFLTDWFLPPGERRRSPTRSRRSSPPSSPRPGSLARPGPRSIA